MKTKRFVFFLVLIGIGLGLAFMIDHRPALKAAPQKIVQANAPATNTPLPAATSAITNAASPIPAKPSAPPPSAQPASVPIVYYQDKFSRRGDLEGSVPDVKNTGDNDWSLSTDQNSYVKTEGSVTDSYTGYDAAFLPVNGDSGVPIDGRQNVVLSATITPDDSGHWLGIGLNASPFIINQGNNVFCGAIAVLTIANSHAEAYQGTTQIKGIVMSPSPGKTFVISLTYHAAQGTITYAIDGKTLATLADVKPAQMAGLVEVSMGNGASGPKAKISNFILTVGGVD